MLPGRIPVALAPQAKLRTGRGPVAAYSREDAIAVFTIEPGFTFVCTNFLYG